MKSFRELVTWGAGMLLRFNDFQRFRTDGDDPHHERFPDDVDDDPSFPAPP